MKIAIGTSGYSYPFWGPHPSNSRVQNFYKIKTKTKWLPLYAKELKSVEINCTRYRKLTPKMCANWAKQVPVDFKFTVKASTYITHNKKLCEFQIWWDEFYPCIKALGDKFQSVLFQFPPVFKYTDKNINKLEVMKSIIPPEILCAFEFRDTAWYNSNPRFNNLFDNNWTQVILYVPELRHAEKFNFGNLPGGVHIGCINPNFVYIRFHGTTNYSDGTYDSKRMMEVVELVNNINPTVLCGYFNNTDTWTLQPYDMMEAGYDLLKLDVDLTPSAIYDSKLLHNLLKH